MAVDIPRYVHTNDDEDRIVVFYDILNLLTVRAVVQKLVFFTGAMVILPLLAFFICQSLFESSLISGGVAAVMANVVLIGYIVAAFTEDTLEYDKETEESKKSR